MKRNVEGNPFLIYARLSAAYDVPDSFLSYKTSFQLLVAVILSAQCTDAAVNRLTPSLFVQFSTISAVATADLQDLTQAVRSINYYQTKARYIQASARMILSEFGGEVPHTQDQLIRLPGVGRKSANVILSHVYHQPAITVDTHVKRLSNRMGFVHSQDPTKIEKALMALWPKDLWTPLSMLLIMHGRKVCLARKPKCGVCQIREYCQFIQ